LKEVQLHQVSLVLAVVVFLLHILSVIFRKMNPGLTEPNALILVPSVSAFIVWLALPFLLGSVSVAEERKLGTLESQLCLPVTARAQLAIKFGVMLLLNILLCAVVPWLIEGAGILSGVSGSMFKGAFVPQDLKILCAISAGLSAFSFFASTLTRNTLQAMGTALVANVLACAGILYTVLPKTLFLGVRAGSSPLFGLIGWPMLVVILLWLAFDNYKRVLVDSRLWLRNFLVLLATLAVAFTATATVYNRSWELLMNVEPPHGPARLSGAIKPRILASGYNVLALLPDGRLWVSQNSERRFLYKERDYSGAINDQYVRVPVDGQFIGANNWLQLDGYYGNSIGIQSDGSLWEIKWRDGTNRFPIPKVERVGSDSDWKAVAAGNGFFLALKNNGTLWGWGRNDEGQLGNGPNEFTNGPVRIGPHSDWASVYTADSVSIGVKRDGSVWKWGELILGPDGNWSESNNRKHPEAVRWNLDGSDWIARAGQTEDLIVRRDGTLWFWGFIPANVLGESHTLVEQASGSQWAKQLVRVGNAADWADVAISGDHLIAIKRNGSFLENDMRDDSLFGKGDVRKPSKNSDWMAVSGNWGTTLALAADGTLSCWIQLPEETAEGRRFLGPTRRPFWSLNILAGTK
jgi:ABC-type transport system involved in multi-copper enzyme maturation permease subunit